MTSAKSTTCRLSVSFISVDKFFTFSFRMVVYLFSKSRKKEKVQLSELIDISKIWHCFHWDWLTSVLVRLYYKKYYKKKEEKSIELGLKLTTERLPVYLNDDMLFTSLLFEVCVWLARWRKDRLLASCIVVFSRHPAAGFRSFDHHSRPLPSTSGITTDIFSTNKNTKEKEKKQKQRNETKWKQHWKSAPYNTCTYLH